MRIDGDLVDVFPEILSKTQALKVWKCFVVKSGLIAITIVGGKFEWQSTQHIQWYYPPLERFGIETANLGINIPN